MNMLQFAYVLKKRWCSGTKYVSGNCREELMQPCLPHSLDLQYFCFIIYYFAQQRFLRLSILCYNTEGNYLLKK